MFDYDPRIEAQNREYNAYVQRVFEEMEDHRYQEQAPIQEWQNKIHRLAKDNGWWQDADMRIIPEKLALIHSEVSEALEEYRNGNMETYFSTAGKPEGFAVELADAVIRIFDLCGWLGINLAELVRIKHDYNVSRPFRHGGKLA